MSMPPEPLIPDYDPCSGKGNWDLERIISKIKAAALRVGFNLWHIFQPLDEFKTNFLSESKFLSVMLGPMKDIIGLDPFEISELTNYYKIDDGRIAYTRLCQQTHGKLSPPGQTDKEREWELTKPNNLGPDEERTVTDLLAKISLSVTPRRLLIKPFFQEYELIQSDSGMVSKNTFVRVLNFMGVPLTPEEIGLLILKYRHDSDTIKYNAFIRGIDEVTNYLRDHGIIDSAGNLLDDYCSQTGTVPELTMKPVPQGEHLGIQKVWREDWTRGHVDAIETVVAFNKLREQVFNEKLRIKDFFIHYDENDTGRVSEGIMRGCFSWICVSETCFNDLYLTGREIDQLLFVYRDPFYDDKSLWKVFQNDLEKVLGLQSKANKILEANHKDYRLISFDPKELESWSCKGLRRETADPMVALRRPLTPQEKEKNVTLEDVFNHIDESMQSLNTPRKLLCVLAKRDVNKMGYITGQQFEWCFLECGMLLSPQEIAILHETYGNGVGVSWRRFAEDLTSYRENQSVGRQQKELHDIKKAENMHKAEPMEYNVIEILAKIKCITICKRVWINDYMKTFDKHRKKLISKTEFERGLDQCGISLSRKEVDILLDVFSLPSDPEQIEYTRFCRTVDEDSLPPCLTRPRMEDVIKMGEQTVKQHLPFHQWANFKLRKILATAMDKLFKYVGLASTDLFKNLDKKNTGTISRSDLQKALFSLKCLHLISNIELDTVVHCFGFKTGYITELDYMSFLNALDIVTKTKAAAKNQ